MATKQTKPKKEHPILSKLICLFFLIISGCLIAYSSQEFTEMISLTNQLNEVNAEGEALEAEKESLEEEIENLNDVEYIVRYARAKYLATKDDGEQIFTITEEEEDSEE